LKAAIVEGAEGAFRDWIGLALLAIGWQAEVSAWLGGVIMAMGGASLSRAWKPERDRTELWAVIGGAFFVAHITGALCLSLVPDWPIQIIMAAAGFFSRFAIRLALDVAEKIGGKSGRIADRVIDTVLPDDDGKGDA
jgi:hypothetical protein